jgi:hypothetical protein
MSHICADGYHFASLWEILDPASLKYNTSLGYTRADSGQGPPTYLAGWVRTGYDDSTSSTTGIGNCTGWDSFSSSYNGTVVYLPHNWTAATNIHAWIADSYTCNLYSRVWCVADNVGGPVYLPIILRNSP